MAFKGGFASWFALGNAAGTLTNLSSYLDSIDHPQSAASIEVSNFGTTARAYIAGIRGGDKISIKGPFDTALNSHMGSMLSAQAAGTTAFPFLFGPGGSVSGEAKIAGSCLVESWAPTTTVQGRVEFAASLQVTGVVVNGNF